MNIIDTFTKFSKSDKIKYADFYQRYFSNIHPKLLLEIGVLEGDSLRSWKEVFPNTRIVGIDNDPEVKKRCVDLEIYIGDQRDPEFLAGLISKIGEPDIIIDDGGHTRTCQVQSIVYLFPMLKSKGLYIIEDIETSYIKHYNDSKLSIVEYVKTLINPTNFTVLRTPSLGFNFHYVASIVIFEPNICMLKKT